MMDEVITITDKAKKQIREIFEEETPEVSKGLRLDVNVGGCSGLSYKMDITEERSGDAVMAYENFRVFISQDAVQYLQGMTIDYKGGLNGKGFIFENPNAKKSCKCGESFAV